MAVRIIEETRWASLFPSFSSVKKSNELESASVALGTVFLPQKEKPKLLLGGVDSSSLCAELFSFLNIEGINIILLLL